MLTLAIVTFIMVRSAISDITGIHPLILGGRRAAIQEAPFMALYVVGLCEDEGYNTCGASILSERFVLSAAHCYDELENDNSFVRVGTDTIGKGQIFGIENTMVHPQYNDTTTDYDILVIKLLGNLSYNEKVQPIKMANSDLVLSQGAILDTFGFGLTANFGRTSKYLRTVRVPYIDQQKCSAAYKNAGVEITDTMMCAGDEGKDSCMGDSGGPLVYGDLLVGVVSFGEDCGNRDFPGVYARVSSVRKFIDSVIGRSS